MKRWQILARIPMHHSVLLTGFASKYAAYAYIVDHQALFPACTHCKACLAGNNAVCEPQNRAVVVPEGVPALVAHKIMPREEFEEIYPMALARMLNPRGEH